MAISKQDLVFKKFHSHPHMSDLSFEIMYVTFGNHIDGHLLFFLVLYVPLRNATLSLGSKRSHIQLCYLNYLQSYCVAFKFLFTNLSKT